MKTTRKILPALAMLLVSAIMLSTASYAWFASNSTVTATGMSVKVKANNYYLEIATPATTPAFSSGVELTNAEPKDIELVHAMFGAPGASTDDPADLNWYLGTSDSATSVGNISTGATALDFTNTTIRDKYVLYNEVLIRMSPSSDIALSNLTLALTSDSGAPVTTVTPKDSSKNDPMKAALRILAVAYDTDGTTVLGAQIYDAGTGTLATGADNYLLTSVELGKQYKIAIYLYFDGQDEVAMTSNAGNLDAYVVDVAFNATTPTPGT